MRPTSLVLILGISCLGTFCDVLLKLAGQGEMRWGLYCTAQVLVFCNVAIWFWILKDTKLALATALYLAVISCTNLLAGCWFFGESLSSREWCGVVLSIVAAGLMVR